MRMRISCNKNLIAKVSSKHANLGQSGAVNYKHYDVLQNSMYIILCKCEKFYTVPLVLLEWEWDRYTSAPEAAAASSMPKAQIRKISGGPPVAP